MLETLKQILSTGTVDHVEEYRWKGQTYLRVYMTRRRDCAWDGPKTGPVIKLIEETQDATLRQEDEMPPKRKSRR